MHGYLCSILTNVTRKIESQAIKTGFVYKLACKYYHSVVRKEIDLANITQDDHILCIGGGVCPFTAILFHQKTGARVTVIDNNEKCVQKARKIIARLGIGDKVHVRHKEGSSKDIMFADYTVVHFALQVFPMEEVFTSVEKRVVPGTRLLVRRPKACCLLPSCPCVIHKARNIGSTAITVAA
ncbi:MAG: hypothetical protein FWB80_06220 [Defluviitaleaceae bacterium]|nr:hypothetical protein [Defluviitaleaceae bacterium]